MMLKKLAYLLANIWTGSLALSMTLAHGAPVWVIAVTTLAVGVVTWQCAGAMTGGTLRRDRP